MHLRFLLVCIILLSSCKSESTDLSPKNQTAHEYLEYNAYCNEPWYKQYSANNLDSSRGLIEKKLKANPKELPTLTFYAELLRRKREYHLSDSITNVILSLDSSNGNAWRIKSDISRIPAASKALKYKYDFKYYLKEGLRRDPTNGGLLEVDAIYSLKHSNFRRFRRDFKNLYKSGTYTKTALSIARLYLMQLPQDAVLFTAGDMDTYPLLAVQEGANFRKDVTIFNTSLLRHSWYYKNICEMSGIEMSFDSTTLDSLDQNYYDPIKFEQNSKLFIDAICKSRKSKPTCFVSNCRVKDREGIPNIIKGHYRLVLPQDSDSKEGIYSDSFDYEAIDTLLNHVDANDYVEPYISSLQNSPLLLPWRYKRKHEIGVLYPFIMLQEHLMNSDRERGIEVRDWIYRYLKTVNNDELLVLFTENQKQFEK